MRVRGSLLASLLVLLAVTGYLWRIYLWPLSQRPATAADPRFGWPALAVLWLLVGLAFVAGRTSKTAPSAHQ
jgi:hypothetical protein